MGGEPAFEDLYRREFEAVFRACFALAGDREVAMDATQEAFARALTRWSRLSRLPWVAGWVTTTALNHARRALRRRRIPVESHPTTSDPDLVLEVRAALGSLPRRQQEAVILHYLLDMPLVEVAQAMGCELGTVKAHLHRARSAFRNRITSDDFEGGSRE